METVYSFGKSPAKLIEKIIDDDPVMINHIILNKDDFVPKHKSNSNVYIIVVKGTISILLEGRHVVEQQEGKILAIPYGLDMEISNKQDTQLEFFVVKSPSPRLYASNDKA